MKKGNQKKQEEFWSEGCFAKAMSQKEMEEKMKTFHKKHDEDMNYNCKECNKKISAHNRDWHEEMCDNCFNSRFFPDSEDNIFPLVESKGKCRICHKEFSREEIGEHIDKCVTSNGTIPAFLVKASSGPFWVYFSVSKNKRWVDIDNFLRDLWLECCGHLSAFECGDVSYISDDSELEPYEKSMKAKVAEVLKKGTNVQYRYDFGTTTELRLECAGGMKTNSKIIDILARNDPPHFKCEECGSKAEKVCIQEVMEGGGFVCKQCVKKHKCVEPYFLPIVNSPRTGMCGFTGEECRLLEK